MNIVTFVLGLPLAPVLAPLRGLLTAARAIQQEAERDLYDPSRVRRQIEEIESEHAADELPPDVAAERKREVLDRLISD